MAKLRTGGAVGVSRDALRRKQEKRDQEQAEGVKRSSGRTAVNEGTDASIKIYEDAARLFGGPRDGAVYYVSDLEQQQRAAQAMGREFDYKPTKAKCTLPWTGGVEGTKWRYCGGDA